MTSLCNFVLYYCFTHNYESFHHLSSSSLGQHIFLLTSHTNTCHNTYCYDSHTLVTTGRNVCCPKLDGMFVVSYELSLCFFFSIQGPFDHPCVFVYLCIHTKWPPL